MGRKRYPGEFEQMLLTAILRLRGDATGVSIAAELEERAGRRVSRGALYSALDRLEKKGLVRWEVRGTSADRSGQPVRRFELSPAGVSVVRHSYEAWSRLSDGLEELLDTSAP